MLKKELSRSKKKRILIYFDELNNYRIGLEAVNSLICYVFSITERWLYQILKENKLEDFEDIELFFIEGDLKLIDTYASSLLETAKKERRKNQSKNIK
jgi:accessory gene regulator protein AgrB